MKLLEGLKLAPRGAPPELLEKLDLPKDLRDVLAEHDGGRGKLGQRELVLFSAKEIADQPEVSSSVPGLLVFGSDGGAEGYGYLPRLQRGGKYGRISLLAAGAHEFESLGDSLEELLQAVADGR